MAELSHATPIESKPSLETKVQKESFGLGKFIFNTSVGAGAIYATTKIFGADGLAVAGSFPVGELISDVNNFNSSKFRDQSIFGALFTPLSYYGINAVKQVPKTFGLDDMLTNVMGYSVPLASSAVAGGLTFGVLAPAFTSLYYPMEYIIKEKKIKGAFDYTKKKFYKGLRDTMPINLFVGGAVATTYALPFLAPYLFPAMAVANILYKIFLSKGVTKQQANASKSSPSLSPQYAPAH